MSQGVYSKETEGVGGENVQFCPFSFGLVDICLQYDRVQVGGSQQRFVKYYKNCGLQISIS